MRKMEEDLAVKGWMAALASGPVKCVTKTGN